MKIPSIVRKYREQQHLTYRSMAEAISERLPRPLTYQTVYAWETGKYRPRYYMIQALAIYYQDWRAEMAREIMAVMTPELYGATDVQPTA